MSKGYDKPHARPSGLVATIKLLAASGIVLVAGLAVLVVLDVIPGQVFGELAEKALLVTSIVMLASAAIALLMRGKK
jgi:hypothetical protein